MMKPARSIPQNSRELCARFRTPLLPRRYHRSLGTSNPACSRSITTHSQTRPTRQSFRKWWLPAIGLFLVGCGAYSTSSHYDFFRTAYAESPAPDKPIIEKPKKRGATKEKNRDIISSQHLQVRRSWENPGVYAWGSNSGRVAAPASDDTVIKTPRRIEFFDAMLLRDIKLGQNFGAAVDGNGDLIQWGTGYTPECREPVHTLRGKNLRAIAISKDRVVATSQSGRVYSIPASAEDQKTGPRPLESTWFPFWSTHSPISYRTLDIPSPSFRESVTSIASGLEHVLLLTSAGRLFSAASASDSFPSAGQLGVPGLTWSTRPAGPYDQPHEISTLRGFDITQIAAGDYHSLALDSEGRLFSFGDNSYGQLGFDYNSEAIHVDAPSLLPIGKLYMGTNQTPRVMNIAAGGVNSFFAIEATQVASQGRQAAKDDHTPTLGRITADTWASGQGIYGTLGNGRWTHIQGTPTKIKALSGLFEYDEIEGKVIPIRLAHLSVGSSHAAAIMANVTHVNASEKSSENDTNWGADVLWWGSNEFYQLGTGKRNNISNPVYLAPLDQEADKEKGRREEHRFQITPRKTVTINGRRVSMEQRVECGRYVSAVYSGL